MPFSLSALRIPSERQLMSSLEEACHRELKIAGFQIRRIGSEKPGEALRAYCRVLHRSICPKPRVVERSQELKSQLRTEADTMILARLASVEAEMRKGLDLNQRLSRKYYDPSYNDVLFNDLHVHHFHLGDRADSPKRLCTQTKELLYGLVTGDKVHLLHLGDHQSFNNIAFEQLLFRNWPQFFACLGLHAGDEPPSAKQRAVARHCGLTMPVQNANRVYLARLSGQTTCGTSTWVTHLANQLAHQVRAGRDWVQQNAEWIVEHMVKHGRMSSILPLRVRVTGTTVWFIDEGALLWLCPSSGTLSFPGSYLTAFPETTIGQP